MKSDGRAAYDKDQTLKKHIFNVKQYDYGRKNENSAV